MTDNGSNDITNNNITKNKIVLHIDNDKNTKLHYGVIFNNLDLIKYEIHNGAKIDVENYLGWTPLMMCVKFGTIETVDLLLEHKSDASKTNFYGINVFLLAVTNNNVIIVNRILKHLLCGGVSKNRLQKIISPLALSILFKTKNVFYYLLEQNFDINITIPITGCTPLMFAIAMEDKLSIHELLIRKADLFIKNFIGLTAQDISVEKQIKCKPLLPLVIIKSPPQTTMQLSSYTINNTRSTSSGLSSNYCITPNISPITPFFTTYGQQFFFPPNFNVVDSAIMSINDNSLFNQKFIGNEAFSPYVE